MIDNVENLILEHLKALRNELRDFRARHEQDMDDLKFRLVTIERGQAGMKHEAADQYDNYIRQQVNIDQLTKRIERIERRLELSDS